MRTQILFKHIARVALVAFVVTGCVACGQKGPLYLPTGNADTPARQP